MILTRAELGMVGQDTCIQQEPERTVRDNT